jgi:hypothetical protein
MHRYNRDEKLEPEPFYSGSINEAVALAIRYLRETHQSIIQSWEA